MAAVSMSATEAEGGSRSGRDAEDLAGLRGRGRGAYLWSALSSAETIPMVGDAAPAIIALPLAKSISASVFSASPLCHSSRGVLASCARHWRIRRRPGPRDATREEAASKASSQGSRHGCHQLTARTCL